jgi:hypothetical protein
MIKKMLVSLAYEILDWQDAGMKGEEMLSCKDFEGHSNPKLGHGQTKVPSLLN